MPLSDNIRSSLFMMLSMAGFVINDLFIKSLDGMLPVSQVMWLRGAMLSALILIIIWKRGLLPRYREVLHPIILLRSILECGATVLFLSALVKLPFANLSAILQSLPLAVTLGAALFLAEPVGWRRWLAIAVGFVGVLIIIRPGLDGFDTASILVLISVLFAAARDLITRRLPSKLPSLLVSASTAVFITLYGMLVTLGQGSWQPVASVQLLVLFCAAIFLFFGYQFIVLSMRLGEVAYVVPYRYTSLLWAIVFGYWVFDEVPDKYTVIGSIIVVSMGLFTLYREVQISKSQLAGAKRQ